MDLRVDIVEARLCLDHRSRPPGKFFFSLFFFFFSFSSSYFSPPHSPDWQDNPRSNRPERRTALVAGLCPRPEARSAGRACDEGDRGCRRVDRSPPRHIEDANSSTASHETTSNELAQRLDNLPIAADAATVENAPVENRWCQLRDTVQSTALAVLGRSPRQHQDLFDDNHLPHVLLGWSFPEDAGI
nr:unnamed protein product [Spirometra erinaceieuropaei]